MSKIKRTLSISLCFLLMFTTIFAITPTKTQAATNTTYRIDSNVLWNYGSSTVAVYLGVSDFYISDQVYVQKISGDKTEWLGYLSTLKNAPKGITYNSSKPKIASIDKTGKVTTKKTGTTTITVTYKNETLKCKLKVLSKSAFYKEAKKQTGENYKKAATMQDNAAKAFFDKVGKNLTITKSNRYELLSIANNTEISSGKSYFGIPYFIYSPSIEHARAISDGIFTYAEKLNPFSTSSADYFKVKSIKGSDKTITVTLKNKVTKDMIFGANHVFSWESDLKESKTYTFPIVVQNTSNNYKYYGIATVKEGSKKIIIKLQNHKLIKGQTYKLIAYTYGSSKSSTYLGDWLDAKNSFKAK